MTRPEHNEPRNLMKTLLCVMFSCMYASLPHTGRLRVSSVEELLACSIPGKHSGQVQYLTRIWSMYSKYRVRNVRTRYDSYLVLSCPDVSTDTLSAVLESHSNGTLSSPFGEQIHEHQQGHDSGEHIQPIIGGLVVVRGDITVQRTAFSIVQVPQTGTVLRTCYFRHWDSG
jgi:hypothetical protein